MGDEFDEFDDIDDAALLQAIDTSSNAGVSKPATTGSGSCVARTHPLVQQFGNPVAPSRPTAPPGVSRPTLGGNTQFGGQRRSVGAPMTVQQATTVQKSSRGGSHQTTGSFPKTPSGYNKTGSQNAGGISKSTHSPGFGSSPYGSSAQAATPSSSANRSMTMYHGIPQPGSNGLMRQTTLMGGLGEAEASFTASGRQYRGDINEPPTHHELDLEACKTWQYPMNLGNIREYQYTIVQSCLFANTLVALPTGLGKTLIAATVMLNFYRWTKTAKLVFIAPTRPLVSQQVSACYDIAGIPKSDTTILMGTVKPAIRAQEWAERRVIFTTPQTLENDISRGYADPKQIALLVVDEAHRATGNYSAAKACRKIMNFNSSFRVMALTATPGSNVQSVQDVINNLGISKVEIRTEESIDLRQYTHARQVDTRIVDYSDELATVRERFTKALQPITSKLTEFNVFWGRDAMSIAAFTINNAKREWMQTSGRDANQGVKGVVLALFNILLTVAHPIKLLNYHGIIPFYNDIMEIAREVHTKKSKSKYKTSLVNDKNFKEMIDDIETWIRDPDFVDHPKLAALKEEVSEHFVTCDDPANSKVIVFSEFRDSTEHITDILNRQPNVRARCFVGQAASKSGSGGMKQKDQAAAIQAFQKGEFNVLVATSIGEEGLDIGQVDLIVCYDASASPIRMLQRMGRTGRKRAGRVVLLLTRGKEEEKYERAQDAYQTMQKLISSGDTFEYRFDVSRRIVPRHIQPKVDRRIIEIPIENTQNQQNEVDPNKRPGAKTKKKLPPKKFHMPDGAITGFLKASSMMEPTSGSSSKNPVSLSPSPVPPARPIHLRPRSPSPEYNELNYIAHVPPFESVMLNQQDREYFDRTYRKVMSKGTANLVIDEPRTDQYPELQRVLRPTVNVRHGDKTKEAVLLFKKLGDRQKTEDRYTDMYDFQAEPKIEEISVPDFEAEDDDGNVVGENIPVPSSVLSKKRSIDDLDGWDDDDFDLPDISLPPVKTDNVFPKDNLNSEPGSHDQAGVKRRKPIALCPSSPAHLFNLLEDDEEMVDGRPRKIAKTKAKAKAKAPTKKTAKVKDSETTKKPRAKKKATTTRSRTAKPKGFGDNEVGDDCLRSSDMEDSGDEDDNGSDLEGFIDDRDESELEMATQRSDDIFNFDSSPVKTTKPPRKKSVVIPSSSPPRQTLSVARVRNVFSSSPMPERVIPKKTGMFADDSDDDEDEDMFNFEDVVRAGAGKSGLPTVQVSEGRIDGHVEDFGDDDFELDIDF